MSDDDKTTETPPEPAPETTAEKARRERESWPIRLFMKSGDSWVLTDGSYARREDAMSWVQRNGVDGRTYLPARVSPTATTVRPRELVDVSPLT